MHSRFPVLLVLAALLVGQLAAAVPTVDDGDGDTRTGQDGTVYLYLKAGTFDPLREDGPGPSWLRGGTTHPFYIVQFDGPIQRSWREAAARAGADLLDYLPDYGYFALIPMASVDDVEALDHVRYVGPAHAAYRVDPDLWGPFTEPLDLEIVTWGEEQAARTAWTILQEGGDVLYQGDGHVTATLYPALAMALAADPSFAISWVEPRYWPEPVLDNDARSANARQAIDGPYQMNDQAAWSYNIATDTFAGWTGANVTVAVADSGLDDNHPAFSGRIVHYYDYGNDGMVDNNGHGTHCAGIVLGNGSWRASDTGRDGKYSGLAPGAGLVVQEVFNNYYGVSTYNRDATRSGATISSNSWGAGEYGEYYSICTSYDEHTRDADSWRAGDQPLLFTFSAGNDGPGANTVTPPATAKNVITVGAAGNDKYAVPSDTVADFSSRGPLNDGRLKPDIVIPGHMIASTRSTDPYACSGWARVSDGQLSYIFASGTSMAAPGVAGSAAVLTQYLRDEKDIDPSPAMLKASLINGAQPLPGYAYPGNVQGWGSVDLAHTMFEASNYTIFRDDQSVYLDTEAGMDNSTYWFMVEPDTPLKVTLVWTDPGGTAASGKALINDLDLELRSPDGHRYPGNHFSAGRSITDGYYTDRVNNVEGFYLPSPARGIWTISVKAYNVPQGPQDFALVISGHVKKGHVDVSPVVLYASPQGAEEFTTVHLDASIRNLGNRVVEVFDVLAEQVDPDGKVTVLHDGNLTDLDGGALADLGWDFSGKRGKHTLRLTVDPDDLVPESNETNNVLVIDYFFKGYDVRVYAEAERLAVDPGETVGFNLSVRNRGNVPDEFRVSISPVPPGWTAQLMADTLSLDPGGTSTVVVTVIPPRNATAGDTVLIRFTAMSLGNTTKSQTITLTIVVNQIFGLEATAPVAHIDLLPGAEGVFTVRIENPGNGQDRYEMILPKDVEAGWYPFVSDQFVDLGHRSQGEGSVHLLAPNPADAGVRTEFTITIRSTLSGMERAVRLSARVIQFYDNQYRFDQRQTEGGVGANLSWPITMENRGNGPVSYVLSIGAPGPDWVVVFDRPNVTIPGYGMATVNLSIRVPIKALSGSSLFELVVLPSGGERFERSLTFNVLQYHDLGLEIVTSGDLRVTQGMDVQLVVRLTNRGNGAETAKLQLSGLPVLWTSNLGNDTYEVPVFGTRDLTLVLHTSKKTAGGSYEISVIARYGPRAASSISDGVRVDVLTRPDIAVRDGLLVPSDVEVTDGALVVVSFTVENTGDTIARNIDIQLEVNGRPVGQPIYLTDLGPGSSEPLTLSWTANITGLVELAVRVDSTEYVDETREDNNRATVQVNVEPVVLKTSPGLGPVAALVALATLALLVGLRRRDALNRR